MSRSPLAGVEKPWHGEKARAYSWFKNGESEKALKAIWKHEARRR